MEINPYQAPRARDRADIEAYTPQRSPADLPLGACYLFIALSITAIAISQIYEFKEATPAEVRAAVALIVGFVLALVLMGIGLLRHSNRLVWAGFALLTLPWLATMACELTW